MMETKKFIAIGLVLALVVGVTAVFLASGDPDGLESTGLYVQGDKTLTGASPEDGDPEAIGGGTFEYEAPLPDYSMGEAMGQPGEVIAIIVGVFVAFLLGFGVSRGITAIKS